MHKRTLLTGVKGVATLSPDSQCVNGGGVDNDGRPLSKALLASRGNFWVLSFIGGSLPVATLPSGFFRVVCIIVGDGFLKGDGLNFMSGRNMRVFEYVPFMRLLRNRRLIL